MSGGGKPGTELCSSGREEPRASGGGKIELRERTLFVARKKKEIKSERKLAMRFVLLKKQRAKKGEKKRGGKMGKDSGRTTSISEIGGSFAGR